VSVLDKPCETGFFVIHDYSALIATAQKGDYLYSPLMYTDDGYGFQIKVIINLKQKHSYPADIKLWLF